MAMLHILRELQEEVDFSLKVVHVHHGIRGQEADRDSRFVEKICKEWQIPCSIHYYDVPKLSREWKLGEEETGRIVRKEAFGKEISFIEKSGKKKIIRATIQKTGKLKSHWRIIKKIWQKP